MGALSPYLPPTGETGLLGVGGPDGCSVWGAEGLGSHEEDSVAGPAIHLLVRALGEGPRAQRLPAVEAAEAATVVAVAPGEHLKAGYLQASSNPLTFSAWKTAPLHLGQVSAWPAPLMAAVSPGPTDLDLAWVEGWKSRGLEE